MKKYILIQNDGEIEVNSFELIGASTKRGDEGKIGFFGSGLKYSIAYMMRNNISFKVFSGANELKFTTVKESFRNSSFDRICINGKETSYTITMGPTWTEDWFVLREIYCNALDESNCQLIRETETINPSEGKTRIYIEITEGLIKVLNNWDSYFSYDRTPIYEMDKCYVSALSDKGNQKIQVYRKTTGALFRKGIRVGQNSTYLFDYGFEDVTINEDRTAKHESYISYAIADCMVKFISENYVCTVLRGAMDKDKPKEYYAIESYSPESDFSPQWIDFSKKYLLVVKERSGKYADQIERSAKETLFLPQYFAKYLKKELPEVDILGMGKMVGEVGMTEINHTPKMDYLLKDTLKALSEMKYECPYNIKIVEFDDEEILGQADIKAKQIYLSDRVFDLGRREIALTIIEETEHIYSGKGDETRAFQTHLISSWLKTLENANGLFL